MFEREIKFIYDFNLNKVNKLGPYFTFEQLQSIDLHPAILHYISAEIDYLVFEDRQKLLKNSVFDYSGEKISYHFNEITDELKKIKRFSLEYIAKLILHSTSFTVNFLVRPKWTLTRFIFDESKHKTSNEIKQILNYIYYYKFLKKIVISYINSKKILSMNAEEFEELLNKADRLGIETNLKGILSHSLISMAEFFNIGQMQKTRIPLTAVELFLEEKDLPHHLQKLTNTFGSEENARFNIGDYMKVLTTVMITMKEEEPEQDQLILFDEQVELNATDRTEIIESPIIPEQLESVTQEIEPDEEDIVGLQGQDAEEKFQAEDEINEVEDETDLLNKWNSGEYSETDDSDSFNETEATKEITEIVSIPQEEITIKPHTKIRIKVNEDNKIEAISEEELQQTDEIPPHGISDSDDELDSYSSIIKDESIEELVEITSENDYEIDSPIIHLGLEENTDETTKINVEHNNLFRSYEEDEPREELVGDVPEDEQEVVTFKSVLESVEENASKTLDAKEAEESRLELAEILEHTNMTKIIEVIFDYDIEDFANMLDEISNSRNIDDAHYIINETLGNRRINLNSKEAEALRDIITEYFNRK